MRKINLSMVISLCLIIGGSFIVATDLFSATKSSKMKSIIKKQQDEIDLLTLKLKQCSGGGYIKSYINNNKTRNAKETSYTPVYIPNKAKMSSNGISYP